MDPGGIDNEEQDEESRARHPADDARIRKGSDALFSSPRPGSVPEPGARGRRHWGGGAEAGDAASPPLGPPAAELNSFARPAPVCLDRHM